MVGKVELFSGKASLGNLKGLLPTKLFCLSSYCWMFVEPFSELPYKAFMTTGNFR